MIPRALDASEKLVAELTRAAVVVQSALDASTERAMWPSGIGAILRFEALEADLRFSLGWAEEPGGAVGLLCTGDFALGRPEIAVGRSRARRAPPDAGGTARSGARHIRTVLVLSTPHADEALRMRVADRSRAFTNVLFRFRGAADAILGDNPGRAVDEIPRLGWIEDETAASCPVRCGSARSVRAGAPGAGTPASGTGENSTRTLIRGEEVELLPTARQGAKR